MNMPFQIKPTDLLEDPPFERRMMKEGLLSALQDYVSCLMSAHPMSESLDVDQADRLWRIVQHFSRGATLATIGHESGTEEC
jgi:hypothetical protein